MTDTAAVDPEFVRLLADFVEGRANMTGLRARFDEYMLEMGYGDREIEAQFDAIYEAAGMER